MVTAQKRAWFVIIIIAISLLGFAILIPIIGMKAALGAFGICGLLGLQPILFRKKSSPDEVETDERDVQINRRATLGAGMISYLTFIATCMTIWGVYHSQTYETISIHALPLIVTAGAIAFYVSHALFLLIGYGRESRHEES